MKALILLAILGLVFTHYPYNIDEQMADAFDDFVHTYHRQYFTEHEKEWRFEMFKMNYIKIFDHNSQDNDWTMAINHFADMSPGEHKEMFHNLQVESTPMTTPSLRVAVSGTVDWTKDCGKVKNQEQCGSCYAFSAVQSLQYDYFKKKGSLVYFSEQQIVDCSRSYGNNGCGGGLMDNCFKYTEAKGILPESEYPYTARTGSCRKEGGWKNSGYTDVSHSETSLGAALMGRPISIAVDANTWSFYSGGINIYIYNI